MTSSERTTRFELLSKLGEGGMGVVYEAYDRERNMRVALKTLRKLDAFSLYQFKREFRALSDLSHPNIIALYELIAEGERWFLSMELVEGSDFLTHVRAGTRLLASLDQGQSQPRSEQDSEETLDTRVVDRRKQRRISSDSDLSMPMILPAEREKLVDVVNAERLVAALSQLAQALYALHSQGMVHRDLKPSNVRITPQGRVVLMDFGIVAEAAEHASPGAATLTTEQPSHEVSDNPVVIGTPSHMAPEQASGSPPTAAADWYAFGVILYQALTGRLPFVGSSERILRAKQSRDPVPPSAYTTGIPQHLEVLCMRLLARNPRARPHGYEVLTALGVGAESISRILSEVTFVGPSDFVGRGHLLSELTDAYEEALDGKTVCVFAEGASGMGKTTLLRRFTYEIQALRRGGAMPLLLAGRCNERESLSYKAFDGVIDQLSRELIEQPPSVIGPLLPEDVDLLTRLFPVLRRIPGVHVARPSGNRNATELRTRAVEALRTLLGNIAAWRPIVMRIEDLHWADSDSLDLLTRLFRPPASARILILASLRTDIAVSDELSSPAGLSEVLEVLAQQVTCYHLHVGPLSRTEKELLIAKLVGENNLPISVDDRFWDEAEGNPLLLTELARFATEAPDLLRNERRPRFQDVIAKRIARLSASARALLEVIAVAGEPTPLGILAAAVALADDERERASATLRVAKLARVAVPGGEPWLSTQHDKIRETVLAELSSERRRWLHLQLAQALETWDSATVPALARHWLAAGDRAQAASYLSSAARAAAEKLAFDRAAELYRVAVELSAEAPVRKRLEVLEAAAQCMVQAGRFHEAALAFEQAAAIAPKEAAQGMLQQSAESLLRSGRIDAGLERLREVLTRYGLSPGGGGRLDAVTLFTERTKLALRGLKYTTRRESEVPTRSLRDLDSLYIAASSLLLFDHRQGALMQSRHLSTALQVGEEMRVCQALAVEVMYLGMLGGKHSRRADELGDELGTRVRTLGNPRLLGLSQLARGIAAYYAGYAGPAAQALAESRDTLEEVVGAEWERVTAQYFHCLALIQTGQWRAAALLVSRAVARAEGRGDRYAGNLFQAVPSAWRWLCLDRAEEAHRSAASSLEAFAGMRFSGAHYHAALARSLAWLYSGDGTGAARELDLAVAGSAQVMLTEIPLVMVELYAYRGRAALGLRDVALARKLAKRVAKLDVPTAAAHAALLEAAVCLQEGDVEGAENLVYGALEGFRAYHAAHLVAACQYRLGQLTGGAQGEELIRAAHAWASEQEVSNPAEVFALLTWPLAP